MEINIDKASSISSRSNDVYNYPQSCKAYVLANYGDPGLEVDSYCDIRSRFVIAIKEPLKRPLIPIGSDPSCIHLRNNIVLVIRPAQLWIDCPTNIQDPSFNPGAPNMAKLKRMDSNKNTNAGSYQSFTENNILPIDKPYALGEEITIQKFQKYVAADEEHFQSIFSMSYISLSDASYKFLVGNTGYKGQTLPNELDENGLIVSGGRDTYGKSGTRFKLGTNYFYFRLHKTYYEDFISTYFPGKNYKTGENVPMNKEYYFKNHEYIQFNCASYVDLNVGAKARSGNNACLPSIIATPDSFLTARTRQPTYLYYTKI